jgi:hypothetical protein
MARRTFDVVDIIEILVHWHAGRNNSEIAASLGVDRKTVPSGHRAGDPRLPGRAPGPVRICSYLDSSAAARRT